MNFIFITCFPLLSLLSSVPDFFVRYPVLLATNTFRAYAARVSPLGLMLDGARADNDVTRDNKIGTPSVLAFCGSTTYYSIAATPLFLSFFTSSSSSSILLVVVFSVVLRFNNNKELLREECADSM